MELTTEEQQFIEKCKQKIRNGEKLTLLSIFLSLYRQECKECDADRGLELWSYFRDQPKEKETSPQIDEEMQIIVKENYALIPRQNKEVTFGHIENAEVLKVFQKNGIRFVNTLRCETTLKVTFKEITGKADYYYSESETGKAIKRYGLIINALIEYNEDASDLVMGVVYPLALSKNALMGLGNYLSAKHKSGNMKDRTFMIENRNSHTYVWNEVTQEDSNL